MLLALHLAAEWSVVLTWLSWLVELSAMRMRRYRQVFAGIGRGAVDTAGKAHTAPSATSARETASGMAINPLLGPSGLRAFGLLRLRGEAVNRVSRGVLKRCLGLRGAH